MKATEIIGGIDVWRTSEYIQYKRSSIIPPQPSPWYRRLQSKRRCRALACFLDRKAFRLCDCSLFFSHGSLLFRGSVDNRRIPKYLVLPNNLANSLGWRRHTKSLLSIHIGDSSIDLALTSHPESNQAPIQRLPTIPMEYEPKPIGKAVKPAILKEVVDALEKWNVCGLIVSWPLQQDGWCGASCGKVLHVLEQIVAESEGRSEKSMVSICLWNGHHFTTAEDEWGRLPRYGIPASSAKKQHLASKEQFRDGGMLAADIASDFIRHMWPDFGRPLRTKRELSPFPTRSPTSGSAERATRSRPWLKNKKASLVSFR